MATAMESAAMEAASMKLSQEVNNAVNEALHGVQDYVAFNLQRSYYRCACACFDEPRRSREDNARCIEQCGIPLERANGIINSELGRFQERLQRSVMICRDKMEEQRDRVDNASRDNELMRGAQACVEKSVQEHIQMLPKLADKVMSQISVKEDRF